MARFKWGKGMNQIPNPDWSNSRMGRFRRLYTLLLAAGSVPWWRQTLVVVGFDPRGGVIWRVGIACGDG